MTRPDLARKIVLLVLALLVPGGLVALLLAYLGNRYSFLARLGISPRRLALAAPGLDLGAAPTQAPSSPR